MASYQILGAQPVYNPAIPYTAELQGGCIPGMIFTITGTVPAKMERFAINFATGQCDGCDVAFHFNPRYDGRDKIVCNTFKNGEWGKEERKYEMPFKKQKDFKLTIEITKYTYQVAVDDKFCLDFKHQIGLERVQWLQIRGDICVKCIAVTGGKAGVAQGPYGF
ncbi:galectin-4-like [Ambystoma mexicanum]|uniref:galectin-4-like n=1 Tax=Ambystoma mexicanum TaxID=8296 RepID=UPI0037E95EE6